VRWIESENRKAALRFSGIARMDGILIGLKAGFAKKA